MAESSTPSTDEAGVVPDGASNKVVETVWLPEEAALLGTLTEKFYGSAQFRWLSKLVVVLLGTAVVFAVAGDLVLIGQTINLNDKLTVAERQGEQTLTKTLDGDLRELDAKVEAAKNKEIEITTKLTEAQDNIERKINDLAVDRVVAQLRTQIDAVGSPLQNRLTSLAPKVSDAEKSYNTIKPKLDLLVAATGIASPQGVAAAGALAAAAKASETYLAEIDGLLKRATAQKPVPEPGPIPLKPPTPLCPLNEEQLGPDQLSQIQRKLSTFGYRIGQHGADGRWGPDTRRAIKDWQKTQPDDPQTGHLDRNEIRILVASCT